MFSISYSDFSLRHSLYTLFEIKFIFQKKMLPIISYKIAQYLTKRNATYIIKVMQQIISIDKVKRKPNLRQITLDDGQIFNVTLEVYVTYKLKTGKEFEYEEIDKIIEDSDKQIGLEYALNVISKAQKSRKELNDKMKQKGINENSREQVLLRLEELNYINDEKYALDFVQYYSPYKGKLRLKAELNQKGIPHEFIENALETLENEVESCHLLAEKFVRNKIEFDKNKLIRHLMTKGFTYDIIKEAINLLEIERED